MIKITALLVLSADCKVERKILIILYFDAGLMNVLAKKDLSFAYIQIFCIFVGGS